mgnify:CR=1 FL=1
MTSLAAHFSQAHSDGTVAMQHFRRRIDAFTSGLVDAIYAADTLDPDCSLSTSDENKRGCTITEREGLHSVSVVCEADMDHEGRPCLRFYDPEGGIYKALLETDEDVLEAQRSVLTTLSTVMVWTKRHCQVAFV